MSTEVQKLAAVLRRRSERWRPPHLRDGWHASPMRACTARHAVFAALREHWEAVVDEDRTWRQCSCGHEPFTLEHQAAAVVEALGLNRGITQ